MTSHHDRHIAIVLNGFAKDPQSVAEDMGYDDVEILNIGDTFGRHRLTKNRITWRHPILNGDDWDVGINFLIAQLGGPDRLKNVIETIAPKAAWLRICVPSVGSPWQESNGMNAETLGRLAAIGLAFDIAAFDYDPANPTHGPRPETL